MMLFCWQELQLEDFDSSESKGRQRERASIDDSF